MSKENETNPLLELSKSLASAVEKVSPAVVAVNARPRVATSGIVWRDGIAVSTNHTVQHDEEISLTFADGKNIPAKLVGRDRSTDLAVLRFERDQSVPATAITTAEVNELKVGQLTPAVGRVHPERGVAASLGIISVWGDKWRTWRGGEMSRLIRSDASIFIGFSGGALIDAAGRVIGINTTGLARGAG